MKKKNKIEIKRQLSSDRGLAQAFTAEFVAERDRIINKKSEFEKYREDVRRNRMIAGKSTNIVKELEAAGLSAELKRYNKLSEVLSALNDMSLTKDEQSIRESFLKALNEKKQPGRELCLKFKEILERYNAILEKQKNNNINVERSSKYGAIPEVAENLEQTMVMPVRGEKKRK